MRTNVYGKVTIRTAGTTFENRQGILWNLRKHEKNAYLTLRREKNNPNDPNAIAIIAHPEGTRPGKIGHVPKETAKWLAKYMDEGSLVRAYRVKTNAPYVIGAGTKTCSLGCQLKIVYELRPEDLQKVPAVAVETEAKA